MAKEYLDKGGLTYLWGKLKDYFQVKLVSGTNIKTVNNTSLLGSGNIAVVPTTRTVNSKALSSDISLTASDVSALPISGGTMTGNGQIANGHITNSLTRETTPNLTATGIRGITALLASSAMTTARPGEGTIIHCEWDNNGGWNSQLFIADNDSGNGKPFVAVRGQRSGTWTSWDRLLASSDVADYITSKGTSGNWYYEKWSSGKIEAIFKGSVTYGTMSASGQLYRSTNNAVAIPSGIFSTMPQRTELTINNSSTVVVSATAVASSTTNVNVQVWRSTNAASSIDCTIRCVYTP